MISDDPVILSKRDFEDMIEERLLRRQAELAETLRMRAAQYELQLLSTADSSERRWLEGISEGLRTAAAEVDVAVRA